MASESEVVTFLSSKSVIQPLSDLVNIRPSFRWMTVPTGISSPSPSTIGSRYVPPSGATGAVSTAVVSAGTTGVAAGISSDSTVLLAASSGAASSLEVIAPGRSYFDVLPAYPLRRMCPSSFWTSALVMSDGSTPISNAILMPTALARRAAPSVRSPRLAEERAL